MRTRKKRPVLPPDPFPMVVETFRRPDYEMRHLICDEPTSFNGCVRIHRYRVTAERIEEPMEVLAERLQSLWDRCDNYHHWQPLREAAKALGYELKGRPGSKCVKNARTPK